MENQTIGGYEILERIGAGAMSRVYLARPLKLPEKRVAVKVLDPALALDQDSVARFRREAHAASFLQHGNVANIMDFGSDRGIHYIVMEYLEGRDLRQILDANLQATPGTGLPVGLVIYLVEEIAYGLRSAHERGIIHRDIKPTNILLGFAGEVKVVDFGLARAFDEQRATSLQDATIDGTFLGTASYASPEQADRQSDLDARTDVFSLGVLTYELLTGRKPFAGGDFESLLLSIRQDPLPSLAEAGCRTVYPELEALIEGMLAKQRDHRLAGMDELLAALQTCREGLERVGIRLASRREHLSSLAAEPGPYSQRLHAQAAAAVGAAPPPAAPEPPSWDTVVDPPPPAPATGDHTAAAPPAADATAAPPPAPAERPAEREPAPPAPSASDAAAPPEPPPPSPPSADAPPPPPPPAAGRAPGHRARSRRPLLIGGAVGLVAVVVLALLWWPGAPGPDTGGAATGWVRLGAGSPGTQLAYRRSTGEGDLDLAGGAEVRRRELGPQPQVVALAAGNWLGAASHPQRASQTRAWHVAAAETTTVTFALPPAGPRAGLLVVTDPPGAQVFLDGEPLAGRTPGLFGDLTPGTREVRLVLGTGQDRREAARTVELAADAETRLILPLPSAPR